MKMALLAAGIAMLGSGIAPAAAPGIAQLRHGHRILIVSDVAGGRALATQRATLAAWDRQGRDRDVATVIVDGPKVEGASDAAAAIRTRYAVPADAFAIALVGKDGHVPFRSSEPVTGTRLEQVIDAMPMRRAGQR